MNQIQKEENLTSVIGSGEIIKYVKTGEGIKGMEFSHYALREDTVDREHRSL